MSPVTDGVRACVCIAAELVCPEAMSWEEDQCAVRVTLLGGGCATLVKRRTLLLSEKATAVSTLLIVPPGAAARGLQIAMQSIPEVRVVDTVVGCLSATEAIPRMMPDLVIISGQIPPAEILALMEYPGNQARSPRFLVISESHVLKRRFLDAGAFAVLTPWDSLEQLRSAIVKGFSSPWGDSASESGWFPK